ncbi:hypothetical protein BgiBS90_026666 [Biomphalaria glabrata]|nr:hypothetical protein BgiBS90_026666 [Biomphalaria glabrata]
MRLFLGQHMFAVLEVSYLSYGILIYLCPHTYHTVSGSICVHIFETLWMTPGHGDIAEEGHVSSTFSPRGHRRAIRAQNSLQCNPRDNAVDRFDTSSNSALCECPVSSVSHVIAFLGHWLDLNRNTSLQMLFSVSAFLKLRGAPL